MSMSMSAKAWLSKLVWLSELVWMWRWPTTSVSELATRRPSPGRRLCSSHVHPVGDGVDRDRILASADCGAVTRDVRRAIDEGELTSAAASGVPDIDRVVRRIVRHRPRIRGDRNLLLEGIGRAVDDLCPTAQTADNPDLVTRLIDGNLAHSVTIGI